MSGNVILFYDIPSQLKPSQAWSPNTLKTRIMLNYKGLPYKTVWVESPDIEAVSKEVGVAPIIIQANGQPLYTLPAIHDPATGTTLSDSLKIAAYLDAQYPDTPKLISPDTVGLHDAFSFALEAALDAVWAFILPATNNVLNPKSEEYFRRTREKDFGKRLEDVVPAGEEGKKEWAKVKTGFNSIEKWIIKGGGEFVTGNTVSFADVIIASFLLWFKRVWGETSQEWKDISSWNEGRWVKRLQTFEKYFSEDN
ncbi:hypothetical protein HGRIS_006137 [Hohenbuehelia grisea]|uniref:GST N-terminal domain-containing protein n=1 Tax=Hohenbuehelia grisea TaxID=104357 RepID=A0ABR3K1C1_9AGAR